MSAAYIQLYVKGARECDKSIAEEASYNTNRIITLHDVYLNIL